MGERRTERTFTLKDVKETFFPNIPLEELEEKPTEEQIQKDFERITEMARKKAQG